MIGSYFPSNLLWVSKAYSAGEMTEPIEWLAALLTGTLATSIAILAVATVGFMLLSGRVQAAQVARVVLGCFIVFGAASIATGVSTLAILADPPPNVASQSIEPPEFRTSEFTEGAYTPYPGAASGNQRSDEEAWLDR